MYQKEDKYTITNPKVSKTKYWFALYTKPKHESKAALYLNSIELENYLPTVTRLKQWSDRKKKVTEPLFKGYIFVHCNEIERFNALQHESIISTVCFSGQPARIPDWQIDNLKKMLEENRDVYVKDTIEKGTKVKIVEGPFKGIEGIVTQSGEQGREFGITIDFLRRSVLVKLPKESITKEISK